MRTQITAVFLWPGHSGTSLLATVACALVLCTSAFAQGVGVPAQILDIDPETSTQQHPTTDYGPTGSTADDREGTTTWRIVKDTGNCCENHFTASQSGRLFDIGGSYVNYTDDRGVSWKSVQPLGPLVNGEGSITVGPNGDILGITWDAYSGDHLLAYKYDAATQEWLTLDNALHHPFYDRPWISVVPGPFSTETGSVPYITFVHGGYPVKDPMFVSTDGLNYAAISSTILDSLTDTPVQSWFPIQADPSFDWIQPITRSPVAGLGAGKAVAGGDLLLDPADITWDAWSLPGGASPPSGIQVDSIGRVHHVRSLSGGRTEYRISSDNGETWTSAVFFHPFGGLTDFKANFAVGVAAIALRLNNQDWVYKVDISDDAARLMRVYRVGLGDTASVAGVTVNTPRMDFQTVAIFPDGRVAVSFLDSTTLSHPPGTGMLGRITPAAAIELDTALPDLCPDDPDKDVPGLCGCGIADVDGDGDSWLECEDNCPLHSNIGQEDTDADGVGDVCDNCLIDFNPTQCNTNGHSIGPGADNFGNICDADLDDNGIVNSFDLTIMRQNFGAEGDNVADLDCNGVINSFDLAVMRGDFGQPPGPSGLTE